MQVSLHDPSLTPEMTDQGFVVAPGTHTLVAVHRKQVLTYWTSDKNHQVGIFARFSFSHRSIFILADAPSKYPHPHPIWKTLNPMWLYSKLKISQFKIVGFPSDTKRVNFINLSETVMSLIVELPHVKIWNLELICSGNIATSSLRNLYGECSTLSHVRRQLSQHQGCKHV